MDDVMRQWAEYDSNKDDYVTWDEFRAATFGDHQGDPATAVGTSYTAVSLSVDNNDIYDSHRKLTYKDIMKRDARRFAAADLDGDKKLTKDELADFLHPGMTKILTVVCLSVERVCVCRGCSSYARDCVGRDNG